MSDARSRNPWLTSDVTMWTTGPSSSLCDCSATRALVETSGAVDSEGTAVSLGADRLNTGVYRSGSSPPQPGGRLLNDPLTNLMRVIRIQ